MTFCGIRNHLVFWISLVLLGRWLHDGFGWAWWFALPVGAVGAFAAVVVVAILSDPFFKD